MGTAATSMGGRRWGRWLPGVLPVALIGVGCEALDFLSQPGGLAIQRFQADHGLVADGIVGKKTRAKLQERLSAATA